MGSGARGVMRFVVVNKKNVHVMNADTATLTHTRKHIPCVQIQRERESPHTNTQTTQPLTCSRRPKHVTLYCSQN